MFKVIKPGNYSLGSDQVLLILCFLLAPVVLEHAWLGFRNLETFARREIIQGICNLRFDEPTSMFSFVKKYQDYSVMQFLIV